MGQWQMRRNVPSDDDWRAYEKRLAEKEAEFKGPGTMPDHVKWKDDEWARWLAIEKKLEEMAAALPKERKAMLTAEATAVINESYQPLEGKEKPSPEAVQQVAEMLADYVTAFKRMPEEFKLFDDDEQERIMQNNSEELRRWPAPLFTNYPEEDDRWEMFLQRLYLEHLRNIGYYEEWLNYHFADLYYLTLHPKTFSKGLTYLIDTDTERLIALHDLWENLSPWIKKPSNLSEWRRKYEPGPEDEKNDPTGKSACDQMESYSSDFKTDRPLLEGKEKQTQRKMLYWFSQQKRYNNPQIVWERLDIQKAIFEAKGSSKLVTVVATEVYRKMAERQAKINKNYQSLHLNGRQALTMDLDKID